MPHRSKIILGVNIDHVATLRKLRDTPYPNLVEAAKLSISGGADQITVHLREDRRHIIDSDVLNLKETISVPLNLEMAATEEMLAFSLKVKPHSICVVPEKREERTTEGGLDFSNPGRNSLMQKIATKAREAKILVSFFIEPDESSIDHAKKIGAEAIELHTGSFCIEWQKSKHKSKMSEAPLVAQWNRLKTASTYAKKVGLRVHAGHGIDTEIASFLAEGLPEVIEYNIGHAIVCDAVSVGIEKATANMKHALRENTSKF